MSDDGAVRDFRLPDLGEGLEEGEILAWHVTVGDVVELNQPIADIETAKAVVSVPSPFAGKVIARVGEVGDTLAVGSLLLRVRSPEGAPVDEPTDGDGTPGASEPAVAADPDTIAEPTVAADPDTSREAAVSAEAAVADDPDTSREAAVTAAPSSPTAEVSGDDDGLDAVVAGDAETSAEDGTPAPLVGYANGQTDRSPRRPAPGVPDGTGRPRAKPPVRKLARDLGVDLTQLRGSGPEGVITRDDVEVAAGRVGAGAQAGVTSRDTAGDEVPAPGSLPGFRGRIPGEVEPIRGIRRRIVEKMETSRREIPTASCTREVDLTRLWELRSDLTDQARRDGVDVRITPFALVMRATVLALRRFPTLNAGIVGRDAAQGQEGEIHLYEDINLGVAVDTENGLMVPNIKRAHTRSLAELAAALSELAHRARDGQLEPVDLTGGTFTVNNYGAFGNDDAEPIINYPEAGILGVGAIRERPWVVDGELAVRRVATIRLAFDHRVCDGGEAGRFVAYVADLCEEPTRILLYV